MRRMGQAGIFVVGLTRDSIQVDGFRSDAYVPRYEDARTARHVALTAFDLRFEHLNPFSFLPEAFAREKPAWVRS